MSPWSSADIKEHVKQLEKAVSGKEPRYVLRALRMLPSTSRRLNHYVLYKAVHGFFTSNNATRDFLLPFLEEVRESGAPQSPVLSPAATEKRSEAAMLVPSPHGRVHRPALECHPSDSGTFQPNSCPTAPSTDLSSSRRMSLLS